MISIKHRTQIDLNLRLHEVLNLNHLHPGMAIECEQGVLWITSAGDVKDYTLAPGERFIARNSSSIVIEAVKDAVLNLKDVDQEFSVHIVA